MLNNSLAPALLWLTAVVVPPAVPSAPADAEFVEAKRALDAKAWDQAIPVLEGLAEQQYRGAEPYLLLRFALEQKHGVEGAITLLRERVLNRPDDAVSRNNLSCFLMKQGNIAEAKEQLLEALKVRPLDIDARFNLAFLHAQIGQVRPALEHYQGILERFPDDVRALSEICYLMSERQSNAGDAQPFCERALRASPGDGSLAMNLGLVQMRAGNMDAAEVTFQRILEAAPENAEARTYLGYVALQHGRFDEAKERFEVAATAGGEKAADAIVGLARAHQARREYREAAASYRRAYELTGNGIFYGALIKVHLQRYYYGILAALLAAMIFLLWKYLGKSAERTPVAV